MEREGSGADCLDQVRIITVTVRGTAVESQGCSWRGQAVCHYCSSHTSKWPTTWSGAGGSHVESGTSLLCRHDFSQGQLMSSVPGPVHMLPVGRSKDKIAQECLPSFCDFPWSAHSPVKYIVTQCSHHQAGGDWTGWPPSWGSITEKARVLGTVSTTASET